MSANLQSQAVQVANAEMQIGGNLASLKIQIDAISAQYIQLTLGTTFSHFVTYTPNLDGSRPVDPDGTPIPSNPMDYLAPGQTGLTRGFSPNDLGTLLTGLQAISDLLAGKAVTQQGALPQILAKLVGG